jgi:hypothetical protein
MMNSIRLHRLASQLWNGEAQEPEAGPWRAGNFGDPCCVETVSAAVGIDGVFGDGTAGSWSDVNQGSPAGRRNGVHGRRPEEPCPEGDRASIGAKKRGNARGAKGGRKVKA